MEGDNNNEWTDTGSITFLLNWNLNKASEYILRSQSVLKETNSAQQALLSTIQKENEKKTKTINNLHTQLKAAECTIEEYKTKLASEIKLKEEQKEIMQNAFNTQLAIVKKEYEEKLKKADLEMKSVQLQRDLETRRCNKLTKEIEEANAIERSIRKEIAIERSLRKEIGEIAIERSFRKEVDISRSLRKLIEDKELTIEKTILKREKKLEENADGCGDIKRIRIRLISPHE